MQITGYESNQMILDELGQRMKDTKIVANYFQAERGDRWHNHAKRDGN